ncbi:hypothetical protein SD71_10180 [Cohnella kolymensis]|uniref:DUF4179 domain-containing protein n=1 Tax=Cohnella kolymensis TaxID=1590652 RepID=A0ABR5A3Z6_9BACL|nr:DUF4179 domain-containing protein [Cohnella kolymensis]KIL35774.1 hypothetical protein SD71_10180 [Cohnella kolymensis]
MAAQGNEFNEEDMDLLFEQTLGHRMDDNQTVVPSELGDRIRSVIRSTADRQRKNRRWQLSISSSIAAAVILLAVIVISPTLSAFAKQWLGLQVPVSWKTLFAEYSGIQDAQVNNYRPIPPVTVQKDGISITLENIYLEEERLVFYAAINGAVEKQRGYRIASSDFQHAGWRMSNTTLKDEHGKKIDVAQIVQTLDPAEVQEFLKTKPDHLNFEVMETPTSEGEREHHFMDIQVPFDGSSFLKSKRIALDNELTIEKTVSVELNELTVSPTEMKLNYTLQRSEGMEIMIDKYGSEENPYIVDKNGDVYASKSTGGHRIDGDRNELTFHPSVYFKSGDEAELHIDKVWITDKNDRLSFDLSLKDQKTFPQTIQFHNHKITIMGSRYENGHLYLDINKAQPEAKELRPWKMEFGNYILKMNEDPELFKLYQEKYKVYSGQAYGRSYLKIDSKGKEVPGVYQVMIMAPEQDKYTLNIYRYEDAVIVNKVIPITVP